MKLNITHTWNSEPQYAEIDLNDDALKTIQGGNGCDYSSCGNNSNPNYNSYSNYNNSDQGNCNSSNNTSFYTPATTYTMSVAGYNNSSCQNSSPNVILLVVPAAASNNSCQ